MSMYSFVDTTGQTGTEALPAEAMSWNGVYLESVIPGYRTLYVRGRESIDTEITDIDIPIVDGSRYQRKRHMKRTLFVGYQLVAGTNAAFRNAFNLLNSYLDAEEAQIIFNDENDKYFVGTRISTGSPQKGRNAITAEIEIRCSDPYKYQTTETEVTATSTEDGTAASFNYDGTHPAYPVLEITCNSNIGFAGASDEDGHVIQIGDPLEPDQEEALPDTESVVTTDGKPPSSWTLNDANFTLTGTRTKTGSKSTATVESKSAVKPSYGSGTGWHGPLISYSLPNTGSIHLPVNATFSWRHLFYDSSKKYNQLGLFQAEMVDANGASIAAVLIFHSKKGDKNSTIRLYVGGAKVKEFTYKATKANTYTGTKGGVGSMEKFGEKITFKVGSKVFSFTDTAIAEKTVAKCGIFMGQSGTVAAMAQNCVYQATVISHQVESHEAIPNKFQSGDVITVDCGEGAIFLNGVRSEGIGALGNDYETFRLMPGANTIGFVASDWAQTAPTFKVKYRKVYI